LNRVQKRYLITFILGIVGPLFIWFLIFKFLSTPDELGAPTTFGWILFFGSIIANYILVALEKGRSILWVLGIFVAPLYIVLILLPYTKERKNKLMGTNVASESKSRTFIIAKSGLITISILILAFFIIRKSIRDKRSEVQRELGIDAQNWIIMHSVGNDRFAFDSIDFLPGGKIQYYFTGREKLKEEIDTSIDIKNRRRQSYVDMVRTDLRVEWLRKREYTVIFLLKDREFDTVDSIIIEPQDYK
jgi:uncharacterized membrane protein (DUF485 family)